MDKPFFSFDSLEKSKIKSNIISITYAVILLWVGINMESLNGMRAKIITICSPFIIGFIIAYLLNRPFEFVNRKLLSFMDKYPPKIKTLKKPIGILITYSILFVIIGSFLGIVIPQIATSGYNLVNNMSVYFTNIEGLIANISSSFGLTGDFWRQINQMWANITKAIADLVANGIPMLISFLTGVTALIANATLGFIVSIYFLVGKDKLLLQVKKFMFAVFPRKFAENSVSITRLTHKTFGNFIMGQLTVAMILGVLCFISMTLLKMPYAMLVSVIIGFTNIIPYFGPFIGAVPGVFILLTVDPIKAGMFIILVIVLQQVDNTLVSPKIVGGSLGLSGMWVLFALTIGGGLFGLPGMIIGAPTFAVIYTLIRGAVYKSLENKNITDLTNI